jgi:transketolase
MSASDLSIPAGAATRAAFKTALIGALAEHDDLVCIDTDTGLFVADDFGDQRDRYLNVGIAEHTAVSIGAGMARAGMSAYVCMFAAFAANRATDAIKLDVAYGNLPVRIAATHSGLSAGFLGPTHHCLEDLAYMRALPNMTVLVPADADQTTSMVQQSLALAGPVYLRLGRKDSPVLPDAPATVIGVPQILRPGDDVVIFACGPEPVAAVLEAAELLAGSGVVAGVVNLHTLKPIDAASVAALVPDGTRLVVTVEDHWRSGGLGDAVSDALGPHRGVGVLRLAVPDEFLSEPGGHIHLLALAGIHPEEISTRIVTTLACHEPPLRPQDECVRETATSDAETPHHPSTPEETEMTTTCITCTDALSLPEVVHVGEVIDCPHCMAELEVLSLDPPQLVLAPEPEEDWGE